MKNILSQIGSEGLVDDNLFSMLFCDGGTEPMRIPSTAIPKLMFNTCVFYADILQLILVNKAMNADMTLAEVCKDDKVFGFMDGLWNTGRFDIAEGSSVFSFLEDLAKSRVLPNAFEDDAVNQIVHANNYYVALTENQSQCNISDLKRDCISLFRTLSLLKTVRFNDKRSSLTLNGNDWINALPFFLPGDGTILLATSMSRGESNNQLSVDVMPFNSPNREIQKESVNISSRNDEYLKMVCDRLGIGTEWYDQEEYLGSCSFVIRLAEIISDTVCQYTSEMMRSIPEDVMDTVRFFYSDSPMVAELEEITYKIDIHGTSGNNRYALQNVFIGLIISHGAFNVTYQFFVNNKGKDSDDRICVDIEKLFEMAVDNIRKHNYMKADRESCINKYREEINDHIRQLKNIVSPESEAFRIRTEQIKGEHMASCIMELIGIETENLFIDQENLLSIYDYFDIMMSRNEDVPSILRRVVSFLIKFYSKMTGITAEVLPDMDPCETLAVFKDFCERTMAVPECKNMEEAEANATRNPLDIIGRKICEPGHLDLYIRNFRNVASWDSDRTDMKTEKFVFISYAHDDSKIAHACAELCMKQGLGIYIDNNEFKKGNNWRSEAQKALANNNCCGVLAFLNRRSVVRDTIRFELTQAHNTAKQRMRSGNLSKDEFDNFIIPVNLEEEPIKDWMSDILAATEQSEINNDWNNALEISDLGIQRQLYCSTDNMDEVVDEVRSRVESSDPVICNESMSDSEAALGSFLTFLIDGTYHWFDKNNMYGMKKAINAGSSDVYHSIYPLLLSVKETRIKRDKVTILGYEILNGKGKNATDDRVMLSSRNLPTDDYYCIPNIRSCGECGKWMANPYLLSSDELR